jgi:integrase
LKLDIGHDAAGKRITEFHTHRGSKRSAQARLAELVAAVAKRAHVPRSATTVSEYVTERIGQWEKLGRISPKTAERYYELHDNQIAPHLGAIALQDLKATHIECWHATLRVSGRKDGKGGVSALTIRHAHRLLSLALKQAARFDLVLRNVAASEPPPRTVREEIVILDREAVCAVVTQLKDHPVYPKAIVALFTGLRRSEVLALRWNCIDLEQKSLQVREALEETTVGGLRFKEPKSAAGNRTVTLPDIAVSALREQWRAQLEARMALGVGRPTPDMLVFGKLDGAPMSPRALSKEWRQAAASVGLKATYHALRHTHISHLIDAGVDVVRISKRVGHSDVAVTLRTYAHLFDASEDKSAAAINEAVTALLGP